MSILQKQKAESWRTMNGFESHSSASPSTSKAVQTSMPVMRRKQTLRLFLFFIISFIWQETLFCALIYHGLWMQSLLFFTLFSSCLAAILAILCSFGNTLLNQIIAIISSIAISLLFCTQYVYYQFFKVPLSAFSFGQAGQINEFADNVISVVFSKIIDLLLLALPTILLIAFGKKFQLFSKSNNKERILLGSISLASYAMALVVIGILGSKSSAYNLYVNINDNDNAQRTFGVVTNMRMDVQRLIFGFEEKVSDSGSDFDIVTPSDNADPSIGESSQPEPEPEPINYEPNIMQIDFDELISKTKDSTIKDMHSYFKDVEPTLKNKYTGIFKGCNLIMLTGESFSTLAVSEKYTPTLYKLVNGGFHFTNFYNPVWGVSTSDGEYVACTGLIPKSGVWSFFHSAENYMPFCFGNQFGSLEGYTKPRAYHNHTYTYYKRHLSHPNIGYKYKGVGNGLNVKKIWPESDVEMMEVTIPEYINDEHFHTYYMTVSGHMFYSFSGNAMASRNKAAVQDAPYPDESKAYLAANIELDKAMKYLLDELEKAGKLDNTVIVLSPDHYPYGLEKASMDALAGHELEEHFEIYKSSLVIWKNGMETVTVDKPVSSLDIIPTVSNLFGLEYDSRLLAGKDAFSDTEGLVIFKDRSWLSEKAKYDASTKKVTPLTSEEVSKEYVQDINRKVSNRFKYSALILDKDYYSKVFQKSKK